MKKIIKRTHRPKCHVLVVPKNDSSDSSLYCYKGTTYNRHVCGCFIPEGAYDLHKPVLLFYPRNPQPVTP